MNPFIRFIKRIKFRKASRQDESRNVVDGIVKARNLYKKLSILAHPDRHPDHLEVANDIMQRITANKHNYAALLEIQQEIYDKLN